MLFNSLNSTFCFLKTKRAIALFVFILFYFKNTAQINLIPNPSFENLNIPINSCNQYTNLTNWYQAFFSPDLFNSSSVFSCSMCGGYAPSNSTGYQNPKTGNAYVGIINRSFFQSTGNPVFTNVSEFLGVKLTSVLKINHIYDFSLYYSLADCSGYINNQLSAYFSANQFTLNTATFNPLSQAWYDTNINYIKPQVNNDTTQYLSQDTLNWQPLQGCFIANGGEEYLTIGNFRDSKFNKGKTITTNFVRPCTLPTYDGTYLFIDDVSLYDLGYYSGKAQCKKDTLLCFNNNLVIGNNLKDSANFVWQPTTGLSCTNCPNPIATPTITTKYYVTKTLCSFITKDSITVAVVTPSIIANAGLGDTICLSKTIRLGTADSTYFTQYFWKPSLNLSCLNCAMPFASPTTNVTYTLQRSQCNIINTSTVTVFVEDCMPTYTVPNIFTPNDDGVNDKWGIKFSDTQYIKNFQLNIFNRWGIPILQTPEVSQKDNSKINFSAIKWDGHTTSGEECTPGIYFYLIKFEVNGENKIFKGNVTLIR